MSKSTEKIGNGEARLYGSTSESFIR